MKPKLTQVLDRWAAITLSIILIPIGVIGLVAGIGQIFYFFDIWDGWPGSSTVNTGETLFTITVSVTILIFYAASFPHPWKREGP